jgi:hypothetical protein
MPNKLWCNFLNLFKKYKIVIIVDNNNFNLHEFKNSYKNINFIQIEDIKCKLNGYIDTNFILNKLISGWDKALYYFGVEDNNYDFVWFIEDDVFFYNEDTLLQIDSQYINSDLLSNKYHTNSNGEKNTWHWHKINIQYPPPYYCGMMCAVRFSKKMMDCINDYAKKYNTLFFLEALFPTISIKNNLNYNNPNELNNIYYRHVFNKANIDNINLFHPVKDLNKHIYFREKENKTNRVLKLLPILYI